MGCADCVGCGAVLVVRAVLAVFAVFAVLPVWAVWAMQVLWAAVCDCFVFGLCSGCIGLFKLFGLLEVFGT